jgi:hypothetical protein
VAKTKKKKRKRNGVRGEEKIKFQKKTEIRGEKTGKGAGRK